MWASGTTPVGRWQDRAGEPTDPGETPVSSDDTPDRPERRVIPRAERTAPEVRRNQMSPVNQAARAADALLGITKTVDGYDEPPELYGVLIQLAHLTDHAVKVIDQANLWLRSEHRARLISPAADGGDTDATIDALLAAAAAGRAFSTAIDDAAGHVGHLTGADEPTG
jgi:hypothetical protein